MLSSAVFPVSGSPCVLVMQWSFRLGSLPRVLRAPRCRLRSWCTLQIILYVQMSWTPMSLEHLFHCNGGWGSHRNPLNKYMWIHGLLAPPLWCGFWFGVAGTFCHGLKIKPSIVLHRPPSTLLDCVRVYLVSVCFHFDMTVLMPDTFILSCGTFQNVWCKYLLVSLKYQPWARVWLRWQNGFKWSRRQGITISRGYQAIPKAAWEIPL